MKKTVTSNIKKKSNINWRIVDAVPEEEYNYVDIPEATLEFFKTAQLHIPKPTKHVTMRMKLETLNFFKKKHKHYQTFINEVLDTYVETQKQQNQKQKAAP